MCVLNQVPQCNFESQNDHNLSSKEIRYIILELFRKPLDLSTDSSFRCSSNVVYSEDFQARFIRKNSSSWI